MRCARPAGDEVKRITKAFPRERLIDDYDGLRTGGVSFIEESSLEHAEAEDPLHLRSDGAELGDHISSANLGGTVSCG